MTSASGNPPAAPPAAEPGTAPPPGPGPGPDGPSGTRPPFWRRRSVMLGAVVALVIAVSVVVDLPQSPSPASRRSDARATIQEITKDVAGCSLALREAFTIEHARAHHTLTPSQAKEAPAILADDENGCSYTSQSIVDLANLDISQAGTGRALNHVAAHVLDWADPDGLKAIDDIAVLLAHPADHKAAGDLARQEAHLAADQSGAIAAEHQAGTEVGTSLPRLGLRRFAS